MIGIIGSIGLANSSLISEARNIQIATKFGSVDLLQGCISDTDVFFLPRSQQRFGVHPANINFAANASCMQELGVSVVIGTAVVGSLHSKIGQGDFVISDQFLDFTRARHTVFDHEGFGLVDMTDPYSPHLRQILGTAAESVGAPVHLQGTYVGVDTGRFETRAEVQMYARLGGDIIGMTGVPEVITLAEVGCSYASLAIVSNMAAGLPAADLDPAAHRAFVATREDSIFGILRHAIPAVNLSLARTEVRPIQFQSAMPSPTQGSFVSNVEDDHAGKVLIVVWEELLREWFIRSLLGEIEQLGLKITGATYQKAPYHLIAKLYDRPGLEKWLAGIVTLRGDRPFFALAVECADPRRLNHLVDDLRHQHGLDRRRNGIHCSANFEHARRELELLFGTTTGILYRRMDAHTVMQLYTNHGAP